MECTRECMVCLSDDVKKKKGHFIYNRGRAILIATGVKLLDTKYKFYGFSGDLIETI